MTSTIAKNFTRLSLATASALRFGLGAKVVPGVETFSRPKKMLEMYQKEACPFSRYVTLGGVKSINNLCAEKLEKQ